MALVLRDDACVCARAFRVAVVVVLIGLIGFCQHVSSSVDDSEHSSNYSSRPAVVRSPESYHHPTVRSVALKHVVARGAEQLESNSTTYDSTRGEEEESEGAVAETSWTTANHKQSSRTIGKRGMVPRERVLRTSNRPPYPCNLPPGTCSKQQPGSTCCGSSCVNVSTNPSHCGRCGHMCSVKRECCSGKCRRLATDEKNCGRCGSTCSPGVKCLFGLCGYSA